MNPISLKVPGKVMFSGEFAVLYGGEAVLAPVSRYLYISEVEEPRRQEIPKAAETALNFSIPELHEFEQKTGLPHFLIDDHEFYGESDDGRLLKLGIGSSAAQVVGVIKLRFARAGFELDSFRGKIAAYSIEAHRQAQGGLGSGADVAVCAYEQPIRYRIGSGFVVPQGLARSPFTACDPAVNPTKDYTREIQYHVEYIKRPKEARNNYPLTLLWSGQSANTRLLVHKFQTWAKRHYSTDTNPQPLAGTTLHDLVTASDRLADAWTQPSKEILFFALDEFHEVMLQCSREAGINYTYPKYEEVNLWLREHGCRAKPTGAGGGDMILLIGNLPFVNEEKLIIPLSF